MKNIFYSLRKASKENMLSSFALKCDERKPHFSLMLFRSLFFFCAALQLTKRMEETKAGQSFGA